jgi:alkanesulfonate monooxygenase SsuD/methylene tetrahydromethanopterin reductase-like flavin-dependent oxidoreductase (luciferase family)
MQRNARGPLPPPIDDIETYWSPEEKARAEHMLQYAAVGAPETVRAKLRAFIDLTSADEVMIAGQIYDHAARLRSFEIVAAAMRSLAG